MFPPCKGHHQCTHRTINVLCPLEWFGLRHTQQEQAHQAEAQHTTRAERHQAFGIGQEDQGCQDSTCGDQIMRVRFCSIKPVMMHASKELPTCMSPCRSICQPRKHHTSTMTCIFRVALPRDRKSVATNCVWLTQHTVRFQQLQNIGARLYLTSKPASSNTIHAHMYMDLSGMSQDRAAC